jgi:hypothetical protein
MVDVGVHACFSTFFDRVLGPVGYLGRSERAIVFSSADLHDLLLNSGLAGQVPRERSDAERLRDVGFDIFFKAHTGQTLYKQTGPVHAAAVLPAFTRFEGTRIRIALGNIAMGHEGRTFSARGAPGVHFRRDPVIYRATGMGDELAQSDRL